ncbi:hypothetical protein [Spirosoma pollinicola]|uniref:BZIP transcription factor n=1 Tax=Spirosoma pollinicola TaxID=2057025 RepID=A0A2K8YYI1_9BACT|nr:hypothetical protein [Spirosoma pollinicola]AUD02682.1 hypothetical protein CWM47_13050 [Spirosoma pollinicola]
MRIQTVLLFFVVLISLSQTRLCAQPNTNLILGFQAGQTSINSLSVSQNTLIGYQAGSHVTTSANTFLGYLAGGEATSGNFNTLVGVQAGQRITTGSHNLMLGTNAGMYTLSGSHNLYLGADAGAGAGVNGDYNVALGRAAGLSNAGGTGNIFLGSNADASARNLTNSVAIGTDAKVAVSNAIVLGSPLANVGIGTSAPTTRLYLSSGTTGQSGLRLENLTSNQPAVALNAVKFLTVDASGNVVLGSLGASDAMNHQADKWTAEGELLRNANVGGVVIGNVTRTPTGYGLYVAKGLLTERVKVAVASTADWSDKVFEPGYQLPSLERVAGFIQQRGHLPNVPSAREIVQQGNDLGRTDALLLQKIEELTLYLIDLKKEVSQLRRQDRLKTARIRRLETPHAVHP